MKRVFCFLICILTFIPFNASAYVGLCCGKCGGNMPLNIPGGGVPETHEFRFKLSPMLMQMNGLKHGGSSIDVESQLGMPGMMGKPTGKFMAAPEKMTMQMNSFSVGYSFTDDFFAGLMFMNTKKEMDMQMMNMDGFTMSSEGMGDTMLMTKQRVYADDPLIPLSQVSLFFGLNLPTGSIDKKNSNHPMDRQVEALPYGMQLGSGTFDPTIGFLYQGSKSPYWWGTNITYTPRFYKNARDYNLGDEIRVDLYSMFQLRYDMVLDLQLNALSKGKIEGEMDVSTSPYMTSLWDPNNYGGQNLTLTTGIQWQPVPFQIINLQVGIPLYSYSNGVQLQESYRVALTWYFELPTSASRRSKIMNHDNGESKLGF